MQLAPQEQGQGLVEYAIILALVAIIVIAVIRLLEPKMCLNLYKTNNLVNEKMRYRLEKFGELDILYIVLREVLRQQIIRKEYISCYSHPRNKVKV
jgi:Flp pilus assembly pilin Flp